LQDVAVTLNGAQAGTIQNPGGTLPASSSLGVVNPDSSGLGDAGFFDVYYDGLAGDFPASSFFDVFAEMSVPNSVPPQDGRGTYQASNNGDHLKATNFTVEIEGLSVGGTISVDALADQPEPGWFKLRQSDCESADAFQFL
jgi:hypothetical protein